MVITAADATAGVAAATTHVTTNIVSSLLAPRCRSGGTVGCAATHGCAPEINRSFESRHKLYRKLGTAAGHGDGLGRVAAHRCGEAGAQNVPHQPAMTSPGDLLNRPSDGGAVAASAPSGLQHPIQGGHRRTCCIGLEARIEAPPALVALQVLQGVGKVDDSPQRIPEPLQPLTELFAEPLPSHGQPAGIQHQPCHQGC